jgi:cytoskeleton protein RodZ
LTELSGIGAELRRAREAQGLAVADVAQQLKFASRQIESLENERFDRLPGPTIARGMVRNYARLLNLEPEPLIERMSPKVEPAPDSGRAQRVKQPVPFTDHARRSTLVYAGFSVAVLALVGVVAYEWQQERAAPQFVAPAQTQRAPEPQAAVAVAPPALPAPPAAEVAPSPPPEPVQAKALEKPQKPQPVSEAKPVAAGGVHSLEFICQEESWLEVTDGAGRALVSSLYAAGSERLVRGRGPLEIVVGNARGVTLIVDGKPVDLKPHTRVDVARLTIK